MLLCGYWAELFCLARFLNCIVTLLRENVWSQNATSSSLSWVTGSWDRFITLPGDVKTQPNRFGWSLNCIPAALLHFNHKKNINALPLNNSNCSAQRQLMKQRKRFAHELHELSRISTKKDFDLSFNACKFEKFVGVFF